MTIGGSLSSSIQNIFNNDLLLSDETLVVDASNTSISFAYDDDKIMLSAGAQAFSRSSTNGLISELQLGNVKEIYSYSPSYGELSELEAKYNSTSLYKEILTRDNMGRIATKTEQYGASASNVYAYTYDGTGRLTGVTLNGNPKSSYFFDSNSNRTSQTLGGISKTASYDDQDRLLTFGSKSFTYNINGEVATMLDGSTMTTYTYDVVGNLKQVSTPIKNVYYQVDAHNRRVSKKVGSIFQNYFIWNSHNQLIAITDSSGVLSARFVYGSKSHVPDYMIKNGIDYKIVSDHLGSPVMVVDSTNGVIVQQVTYDEFGNVLSDSSPGYTPFGFAGCLYDVDTKLCRFGGRDYDASIGRWLSKDPILFNGGDTNLYGYVLQDPINLIDPTGLDVTLYIAPPYHSVIGVTNPNSPTGMTYGDFYPRGNQIGLTSPVPGKVNIGSSYPSFLISYATYKTTPAQDGRVLQNMRSLRDMANNGSYPYSVVPPATGAMSGQAGSNCFGFSSTACGGACK